MEINLPEYYDLQQIIIKVPKTLQRTKEKVIIKNRYTKTPRNLCNVAGIYLIEREGKIIYIGSTSFLRNRMWTHRTKWLDNTDIDYIWFYPEEDRSRKMMIEAVYKFKYLNNFKVSGFTWIK